MAQSVADRFFSRRPGRLDQPTSGHPRIPTEVSPENPRVMQSLTETVSPSIQNTGLANFRSPRLQPQLVHLQEVSNPQEDCSSTFSKRILPPLERSSLNLSTAFHSRKAQALADKIRQIDHTAPPSETVSKKIQRLQQKLSSLNPTSSLVMRGGPADFSMDSSASLASIEVANPQVRTVPSVARSKQITTTFDSHLSLTIDSSNESTPSSSPQRSTVLVKKVSKKAVKKREQSGMLVALSREVEKLERAHSRDKKEDLRIRMWKKYQIRVSQKKAFFTNSQEFEQAMFKRCEMIRRRQAIIIIQRQVRWKLARNRMLKKVNEISKAVRTIQRSVRSYYFRKRIQKRIWSRLESAAMLVQRATRGYFGRQSCLMALSNLRADTVHDYFSRIEHIMRSHSQRVIRRAWLRHKKKKEEKAAIKMQNEALRGLTYAARLKMKAYFQEKVVRKSKIFTEPPKIPNFTTGPRISNSSKKGGQSGKSARSSQVTTPPKKSKAEFEKASKKHLDDLLYSLRLSLGMASKPPSAK